LAHREDVGMLGKSGKNPGGNAIAAGVRVKA
jgi:hypothetical protein